MVRKDAFRIEGTVTEVISPSRCWVSLANGHRLLAHLPARFVTASRSLSPGDTVRLELSPYDLSAGRIIVPEKATNEA
jgi:translation initiation factor IF-1